MADNINWIAVGSWSAFAAFNFGTAGYKIWKKWRKQSTDYEKVINGETVNGWRRLVSRPGYDYFARLVYPSFGNGERDSSTPLTSNFVLCHITGANQRFRDGREMLSLRRYSLVNPSEELNLLKIVYRWYVWDSHLSCFLNSRIIVTLLENLNFPIRYCVFLTDAYDRSTRRFMINLPAVTGRYYHVVQAYLVREPRPRLHLVFPCVSFQTGLMDRYLDIYDVIYDYPLNDRSINHPSSWGSISIPIGSRIPICAFGTENSTVIVLSTRANFDNINEHFYISFDDNKTWRIDRFPDWLESYRNTTIGKRVVEAHQSLESLSVPLTKFRVPESRYFNNAVPYTPAGSILCFTADHAVLQRWIQPPSLKHTAAVTLFQSNPDLMTRLVENGTGVEISEELVDDRDERDLIIYL